MQSECPPYEPLVPESLSATDVVYHVVVFSRLGDGCLMLAGQEITTLVCMLYCSDPEGPVQTQRLAGGPPRLLFLHGLMGRGRNFTRIAKSLTETTTSLLVDLPNHGNSCWTEHFDYLQMADLVAEELRNDF